MHPPILLPIFRLGASAETALHLQLCSVSLGRGSSRDVSFCARPFRQATSDMSNCRSERAHRTRRFRWFGKHGKFRAIRSEIFRGIINPLRLSQTKTSVGRSIKSGESNAKEMGSVFAMAADSSHENRRQSPFCFRGASVFSAAPKSESCRFTFVDKGRLLFGVLNGDKRGALLFWLAPWFELRLADWLNVVAFRIEKQAVMAYFNGSSVWTRKVAVVALRFNGFFVWC